MNEVLLMNEEDLGHAILHGSLAISAFHEFAMFEDANQMEYEANVFAAEFMLSDDVVLESLEMQMDFFQTAKYLYVPPELLDFKLRVLQSQGTGFGEVAQNGEPD